VLVWEKRDLMSWSDAQHDDDDDLTSWAQKKNRETRDEDNSRRC